MKPVRAILVPIALLFLWYGYRWTSYELALANALKSEANVVAFEKLYPGSKHFISYYSGRYGTPRWNSKTLIYGRYVLTMQFNVSIDSLGTHVKATTPPQFYLVEVTSVARSANGQTSMTYNTASQRQFGPEEWNALQASSGDLSALGLKVVRDQPVPNLAANWGGA